MDEHRPRFEIYSDSSYSIESATSSSGSPSYSSHVTVLDRNSNQKTSKITRKQSPNRTSDDHHLPHRRPIITRTVLAEIKLPMVILGVQCDSSLKHEMKIPPPTLNSLTTIGDHHHTSHPSTLSSSISFINPSTTTSSSQTQTEEVKENLPPRSHSLSPPSSIRQKKTSPGHWRTLLPQHLVSSTTTTKSTTNGTTNLTSIRI